MHIQLDLPAGENQRQFLDQLNAAIRNETGAISGHGFFDENGNFRTLTVCVFKFASGEIALNFSLLKSKEGVLVAIEVKPAGDNPTSIDWEKYVGQFITATLSATLATRKQRFFRREVFNYLGPALDGEYWLPGFRFAPLFEDDPEPQMINAERVVVIDMDIDAVDDMHCFSIAREQGNRHAARVGLLANIGMYRTQQEQRWVIPDGERSSESERLSLGFRRNLHGGSEMPAKAELCKLGKFLRPLAMRGFVCGEKLTLPPESRRILKALEVAPPQVVEAFDRCARLYQVALVCGRIYPSVGFAYRVAAIEAIVQTTKSFRSFSEFIRANVTHRHNLDSLLDYLYGKVRSAHFHGGAFPAGEFERPEFFAPLLDADETYRTDLHEQGYALVREAIVGWISGLLPTNAS